LQPCVQPCASAGLLLVIKLSILSAGIFQVKSRVNMQQYIEFFANHPILSAVWLVLFVMLIASVLKSRFSALKQVSPTELTLQVNRQNALVVDIRAEADFAKGHITGARHLLLGDIEKQQLAGLEKHKAEPIILVCQAGMTAQKAAA